ncbi:MAG: tetraacyldisaccharide 4'-kinase [Arsenophonus sp.]|nr:MAG: tetraacyldisaccharide 4'-kinase [Arsenophonus sp.]
MITKIYFSTSYLNLLLIPISFFYIIIVHIRYIIYYFNILPIWKAPIPIIIVGNITIGGTGKTPVVIWLVKKLLKKGYKVGVISRGYKSKSKTYPLLIDTYIDTKIIGDEAALIYRKTGVPIAIAPKRIEAVKILLKFKKLDIIISDDGLQHYSLYRNYEIIVIDGTRRFGNNLFLPAGPLRECQYRLKTVNAIIVNGGMPKKGEFSMHLNGKIAINMLTKKKIVVNKLKKVVAIAGIGNPNRFFLNLNLLNVDIIKTYSFIDHKDYKYSHLKKIVNKKETLLMTEKDAVKCFNFAKKNWWYLPVYAKIEKNGSNIILNDIEKILNS